MITTTKRRRSAISIPSSELFGQVQFDATKTIPAMDIGSDAYDEGQNLYLERLGIKNIDKKYNEMVEEYEYQFQEMAADSALQIALAAETSANIAVENQGGLLGTGAAAVESAGRASVETKAQEALATSLPETYASGIEAIAGAYQAELESILGKYDASTGTFADLAQYNANADRSNTALAIAMATLISPNWSSDPKKTWTDVLTSGGFAVLENGELSLTDRGQTLLDQMLNGIDVNEERAQFGGHSLLYFLAEQMAKQSYESEYLSDDGETKWELLSESKRSNLITQYETWLQTNQMNLRVSHWGLYDENGVPDVEASIPEPDETVITDSNINSIGIKIIDLTFEDVSDCTEDEFNIMRTDLLSGKIPDGAFITFQAGEMYKDDKYYYITDGMLYKTNYTAENLPPIISVESATVRSFGVFRDTGTGKGSQDDWVQAIIDAAAAGRIPDGTVIDMNYGYSSSFSPTWWVYEDGKFVCAGSQKPPSKYSIVSQRPGWGNWYQEGLDLIGWDKIELDLV